MRPTGERPAGQRFAIDLQPMKSPRAKCQCGELKLEQVLEKAILRLKMLGTEEHSLRPQHGLHLPHAAKLRTVAGLSSRAAPDALRTANPARLLSVRF